MTYSFERWAIDLLKETKNQTKTAKLLRCVFNQLNWMMHRSVERGLHRRSLRGFRHVNVDEKTLKRNHVYATIVSNSAYGVVIDVGEGRTKKAPSRCSSAFCGYQGGCLFRSNGAPAINLGGIISCRLIVWPFCRHAFWQDSPLISLAPCAAVFRYQQVPSPSSLVEFLNPATTKSWERHLLTCLIGSVP